MKASAFWFPLRADETAARMAGESPEVVGCWLLLRCWLLHRPALPSDGSREIRAICAGARPASIRRALAFFPIIDGQRIDPELEALKCSIKKKSSKRSEAGKLGAAARWQKSAP